MLSNILESAPCLVELPTSSLSNTATTFIPLFPFASIIPCKLAWAIDKLSNLPVEINSSLGPIKQPFSYSYKNKSKSNISSLFTLSSLLISFSKKSSFSKVSFIIPIKGRVSFCLLYLYPSFILLFKCIAKLGIIQIGLLIFTSFSSG